MANSFTCGRAECTISKTGLCAEGHNPPESCPTFGQGTVDLLDDFIDEDGDEDSAANQIMAPLRVPLPADDTLSPEEVDVFLRWKGVNFAAIIGEIDSGKTTLLCALYNRFLKGSFAHYWFAGSRTLVGFEKRSHHSRIDSGRVKPDTLRTSLSDGLRYFHLSLVQEGMPGKRVELMLSDRAGETYKKARGNSALVDELIEVKKAHYVVVLLDGERLADPVQRAGALQVVRQTIRAFLDGGALTKASKVQVVTTKIDLFRNNAQHAALEDQMENFKAGLTRDFAGRLGELSFWAIAARDPHGELAEAHGMGDLLATWCSTASTAIVKEPLPVELTTEFDRLLLRTPMEGWL